MLVDLITGAYAYGTQLDHMFESCHTYCSQVAILVDIITDDVVFNTVYK